MSDRLLTCAHATVFGTARSMPPRGSSRSIAVLLLPLEKWVGARWQPRGAIRQ